jgi:cytoplasmic tRNA 2-thiolation protein 2
MPGRRAAAPIDEHLCRRCQLQEPAITVRSEPLCTSCFCRYVTTKTIKRMESFRVRHSGPTRERRLLLPLSFGCCSIALLAILSQHLKGQVEKTGRTGFQLHVLHIHEGALNSESSPQLLLKKVEEKFPEHTYSSRSISDLSVDDNVLSLLGDGAENTTRPEQSVQDVLASLTSATSRADTLQILRRRLIVQFAKSENCEAVLWADSTTRLAERTLAETAKGRGFSLPWLISDGETPHEIQFYYPLRELLSKEIEAYTAMTNPQLHDLILTNETKQPVSTKNTSIDDLMRQYFESVERDYPSIVANVVRTTGKLQAPSLGEVEKQCELCEMPLDSNAPERSRLCYGCIRNFPVPGS